MLFLPFIYVIGFVLSIVALIGWFYFQRKADAGVWFQRLVFLGLALYLGGILMAGGSLDFKLSTAFRDLMLIGGAGLVFNFLVRKKPAFFFGLMALVAVLFWYYQNYLKPTMQYEETTVQVDPRGELLIELSESSDITALEDILSEYDLTYEPAFQVAHPEWTELDDYYVLDIPDRYEGRMSVIERALSRSGVIDWMEANEVIFVEPVSPTGAPSKLPGEIKEKYGIDDPGIEELWSFEVMEMDKLYDYLRESGIKPARKARIAVLDTGVDAEHEDLKDNYKSIKSKYDTDPRAHGTHCAGIAASVSNNGKGVASFSHNNRFVEVSSVKVLSAMGSGTQRGIINGMIEAADKGADVLSMSLGGRSNQSRQRAYEKAVDYANKAGAIVVAAAGNSNRNAKDFSPVNARGVIGVSAIDSDLNRAVFSNYVSDLSMGIAAPGVDILSTVPGGKYAKFSGTSMATPYVSGLVGLMKSLEPSLTTQEVHDILVKTGKDTKSTKETSKLIYPYEAVKVLMERK